MVFPKVGNGLERLLGTQEDYRAGGIVAVRGFTCHHQGRQKMSGSGRSPLFLHICTNSKGSRAFIQENKKWVDLVDLLFFFMSVPIVRGIATNKTKKILKQPVSLLFLNLPLFLYYNLCSSIFRYAPLYLLQTRVVMGGGRLTTQPQEREKRGEAHVLSWLTVALLLLFHCWWLAVCVGSSRW